MFTLNHQILIRNHATLSATPIHHTHTIATYTITSELYTLQWENLKLIWLIIIRLQTAMTDTDRTHIMQ